MPEWNGMEDNLPYFHTNSILDFALVVYRKVYANSDEKRFLPKFLEATHRSTISVNL